jgi:hypothetical protein
MPDILRSQKEDVIEACDRLSEMLTDNQKTNDSSVEKLA